MTNTEDGDIRAATVDDVDAILDLWHRGGVGGDRALDRVEIVTKLDYDGDLFLVFAGDGGITGSVMGTYDGHRGRIKRCVVDPGEQGSGLGAATRRRARTSFPRSWDHRVAARSLG